MRSGLVVGFGVVQRFAADLPAAHLTGVGLGIAPDLASNKEGDLPELRFTIDGPDQSVIVQVWNITGFC